MALGQRHERGAGGELADAPVDVTGLAGEIAVHRRQEGRLGEVGERQPERARVVADDIEASRLTDAGEGVHEFWLRRAEVVGARLCERRDEARRSRRIPGCVQRDVVAIAHEAADEQVHHRFRAAVALRRHGEPRRREHGDAQPSREGFVAGRLPIAGPN